MLDNRNVVTNFLDMINVQQQVREAFEQFVADEYIQHHPNVANGREPAIALISKLVAIPGFRPVVERTLVEGDIAVT
jgi:predicted SnoaL-like aldol condensation-catalyzing enzyme